MLKTRAPQAPSGQTTAPGGGVWQSQAGEMAEAFGKSAVRAIGSQLGREIMRGVLGSIFGSTATRRRR
jgi:DNA double-strand break repair helicase HerA and related ATPase